jgi:hypothetical protein
MWERTLTVSSAGKHFSTTGWKIGWVYGPQHLLHAGMSKSEISIHVIFSILLLLLLFVCLLFDCLSDDVVVVVVISSQCNLPNSV